ncbi:MAG: flagellar L-ring protein precursor FlgH [Phenylobacterium sp.]|jgi:flagellar L-ring protein precursor FlgH
MRYFNLLMVVLLLVLMEPPADATSLYDQKTFKDLTADKRAKVVGDTVTIIVLENAQATTSAGLAGDSEFAFSGGATINKKGWSYDTNYGLGVGAQSDNNAVTKRVGSIRAQISVVVTAVDDNQNLQLQGKQLLTINGESQTIEVTGRARRSDIFSNNTLLSSRLFDADIKFVGQGEVTEGKEDGIFARLFKWLGLK